MPLQSVSVKKLKLLPIIGEKDSFKCLEDLLHDFLEFREVIGVFLFAVSIAFQSVESQEQRCKTQLSNPNMVRCFSRDPWNKESLGYQTLRIDQFFEFKWGPKKTVIIISYAVPVAQHLFRVKDIYHTTRRLNKV